MIELNEIVAIVERAGLTWSVNRISRGASESGYSACVEFQNGMCWYQELKHVVYNTPGEALMAAYRHFVKWRDNPRPGGKGNDR